MRMEIKMALIDCIKKIVRDRYLKCAISEGPQIVELKDKQSKMKIAIREVPASLLAIKMEGQWSQLLEEKGDWNRICDYLLIYQAEDKHHAIFIELKTSLVDKEFGKKQLKRSLPVLDYLRSVCRIESGVEEQEKILSVKYVLIAENEKSSDRLDKQRIRVNPSETIEERDDEILVRILVGTNFTLNTLTG